MLVDEDVRNLNDAAFAFGMERHSWIDIPGSYHNGGCGFAFADGHCESHGWLFRGQRRGGNRGRTPITNPNDQRDWFWTRDRTSANVNDSLPGPRS